MEPDPVDHAQLTAPHPGADVLEQYALGRLAEPQAARLETHLLVCHACQDALAETDKYVGAMKAALAEPELQPAPSFWASLARQVSDRLLFSRPIPAFSVALAALSLAAMLLQSSGIDGREESIPEVILVSERGGRTGVAALGPADSRLALKIQSQHLRVDQQFGVRIVDAAGKPVWEGSPRAEANSGYLLHMDTPLSAGSYWVRLYDADRTLVQEYGLRLE